MDNYKSAIGLGGKLEQFFEEEAREGLMEKFLMKGAKLEWPGLRIAAQGAVLKSDDSFRIVRDGTRGIRLNHELRPRDQIRLPTASEGRTLMEMCSRERPGAHFQMVADISKAHRRVKHRRSDWGLLGCQSIAGGEGEGSVWVNKVGTFGVSTASYWWGRLASAIGRLCLLLCLDEWSFQVLYADDLRFSVFGPEKFRHLARSLLWWEMAGAPFAWRK